eukprot:10927224-Ditylum_brightwellii.AAC.1
MIHARKANNLPVPPYLNILAEETPLTKCTCTKQTHHLPAFNPPFSDANPTHAFFAVHCTTAAEIHFANLSGVIDTEAGFLNHHKTLMITYDSKRLSYGKLVHHAISHDAANTVYFHTNDQKAVAQINMMNARVSYTRLVQFDAAEHTFVKTVDRKHYLRNTIIKSVPLSPLQKARANAYIAQGQFHEATRLLSPRQGLILRLSQSNKSLTDIVHSFEPVDVNIQTAWFMLSDAGFFD